MQCKDISAFIEFPLPPFEISSDSPNVMAFPANITKCYASSRDMNAHLQKEKN
jgi:hypothetical protein